MTGNEQEDNAGTTPYEAAGGIEGITKLVDEFYVNMDTLPETKSDPPPVVVPPSM